MRQTPEKQGLYDPQNEHDACGVGFVVDVEGRKSHQIVSHAIEVLKNLGHRGACGCEENTGDGAGILLQMPDGFLRTEAKRLGFALPAAGEYGAGLVFLPTDPGERDACERLFERAISSEQQVFLGWRRVPTDNSMIGPTAQASQPAMRQVFIGRGEGLSEDDFERKLYLIRRTVEKLVRDSALTQKNLFYVCSLSARTLVYKGMLTADQLDAFFPDLVRPDIDAALALVHSRFSTNTFPSWARAHPYRMVAHNGEINTLRGNVNWMSARESVLESPLFPDIEKVKPVIDQTGSDSGMLDNVLEMLALGGRSLPHAVMMMVPEPWANHESMSEEKKDFYRYHSCLMEPWDGPAAICFTDGKVIGSVLDRNGLRPLRYWVTKDGLCVMASEAGVIPEIAPERVQTKGRIQPGRMFLVDTTQKRIIPDAEIKHQIAAGQPYGAWAKDNLVQLESLPDGAPAKSLDHATVERRQEAFGYTTEDLKLIQPMAETAMEAVGSMGTDTPLAVLSNRPQNLYSYFKQLFAQVTNPPIDAIREEIVTMASTSIGAERNLFDPTPASAHQIEMPTPILLNHELEKLRALDGGEKSHGFKSATLPMLFAAKSKSGGGKALEKALDELCRKAEAAVNDGHDIIILSDRDLGPDQAPIPALLACAAVHHHLLRKGSRTRTSLVLESGEPREVHHFCLLVGYGASAINPYLAFESLHDLANEGILKTDPLKAEKSYVKAVTKGIVKVLSKMGISTVQSYHGAQVFEAIGLNQAFVDKYFCGTASRVAGIGIDVVAEECKRRHDRAFPSRPVTRLGLAPGGQYQWRADGEFHLFNPDTIHKLQAACRTGSYDTFKVYARGVNDQSKNLCTLRGLMEFKRVRDPIPVDQVESVDSIVKRFKTGAMSYGSISKEAHEALAIAMNRIGGKSNTGEGGEDPARYEREPNGDSKNSAIKQVASGRFGVTSHYLVNAQEIQIKMAQGAKPGEGGQLPGSKVYPWIAKVRHSTPGVGLISPPPHHDIYSIEDLAQLIHDLKCANDRARISVKLVAEVGVGTVAAGVAKARADVVLISGHDGGTGASPLTSLKHAGIPWELGLAETHQTLVLNDLRSRIVVETDGQLKTGRDVVVAALLGAEEYGFSTAPLVALGCIMMRVCHLNTCPVGVATQDPKLRARFNGAADHVVNFMRFVAQEARELMAELGFRSIDEMVGHTEVLETKHALEHWKARGLDLSMVFHQPDVGPNVGRTCTLTQDHALGKELDQKKLIPLCKPAIEKGEPVEATLDIRNVDRTTATQLGAEVTRKWGAKGLPDDTIRLHFKGSAGQSFGAFVPKGITLTLEGDANDYLGKGLSGGRILLFPSREATFAPEENVITGNVAFYGATGGEAFIRGMAGERFCVRNSGVQTVVEGIGDHGCEYMTGGRVVILGPTGRNFAAGMSGGIAYILDEARGFERLCNKEMVGLTGLDDPEEIELVLGLIRKHRELTGSTRAKQVLENWQSWRSLFVRVVPHDYKRVLEAQKQMLAKGLSPEEAEMAAFEQNTSAATARVQGK